LSIAFPDGRIKKKGLWPGSMSAASSSHLRASWGTHQIRERSSRSAQQRSACEFYNELSHGQADKLVFKAYKNKVTAAAANGAICPKQVQIPTWELPKQSDGAVSQVHGRAVCSHPLLYSHKLAPASYNV
jgi:hypothetical protein